MPNVLPTPVVIADKMLEFLFEGSGVINDVNRDYESEFAMDANSIGRVVQVKNPPRFTAQDGPGITSIQSTNFGLTGFAIDTWKTIPIELTGMEKTFNNAKEVDLWAEKNIKPLVSPLIAAIETAIFGLYAKAPGWVGTAGTGVTTVDPIAAAMEKLNFHETPQDERVCYLNPTAARKFIAGTTTVLNPQTAQGTQYQSGQVMGRVSGFDIKECNKIASHSVGTMAGSPITNGAYQVGSSIAIDGFTSGKGLKKGDVVTFDTVYACNPVTKKSTGALRQFVVTADVTAAATSLTMSVSPAVIPSGAFQNICASDSSALAGIPDGKAMTVVTGTASTAYAQNLAWWKKAIGLVTVPIAPLEGAVKSVTRTYDGISLTFTTGADVMNYKTIKRVDMAFGVDIFNAYLDQVVRITG
ncbi:MAG TPA: P22 phage major capsid protein family protein [Candidatus Paceibacterota bacterium]